MAEVMDAGAEVLDQPQETEELGAETQETPEEQPEQSTEQAQPEKVDGRAMPKEIQAALKTMRESHPEFAKQYSAIKDTVGRWNAAAQIFPGGVTEMRTIKSALDAAGGADAIVELQNRDLAYQNVDAMLAEGDPRALDEFGEDFKAGLAKLAPHYLDRLEKESPEAYAAALQPKFAQALANTGLGDMIQSLYQKAGDNQEVKAGLSEIWKWFQGQVSAATKTAADPLKADREKLQQEKTQFEQQRSEKFWGEIQADVEPYQVNAFKQALAPSLKALKLAEPATNALIGDCLRELTKRATADKGYMGQINAYRAQKSPNADSIKTYVKQSVDRMVKNIAADVVKSRYGTFLAARKPAAAPSPQASEAKPVAGAQTVPIRVVTKPRPDEVNWPATKSLDAKENTLMKHIYILNSGKRVQWVKPV